MRKLKVFLVMVLIVMSIVLLISCQRSTDNELSKNVDNAKGVTNKGLPEKLNNADFIFLYVQDPPNPTVLKTSQMFEEKYGGKVKYITTVWNEKNTKLATMINAGDSPDLFVFNHTDMPSLAISELLQPIEGYFDINDPIWDKDLLSQLSYKGKIYGANNDLLIFVLFYNEDLFYNNGLKTPKEYYKEGKWNWEALKEVAIKLTQDTDSNGTIDQYGLLSMGRTIDCLIGTNDTDFVKYHNDGNIQPALNDPKLLEVLQFLQDSYIKHAFQNTNSGNSQKMFLEGKGALIPERKVFTMDIAAAETAKFKWDIVPFPVGPSGKQGVSPAEVVLWGIPTGAQNPEAAATWMYLWRTLVKSEGILGATQNLTDEQLKLFEVLENVTKHVARYKGAGLQKIVNNTLQNDIKKGLPIATILEQYAPQFQNDIDNILRK